MWSHGKLRRKSPVTIHSLQLPAVRVIHILLVTPNQGLPGMIFRCTENSEYLKGSSFYIGMLKRKSCLSENLKGLTVSDLFL